MNPLAESIRGNGFPDICRPRRNLIGRKEDTMNETLKAARLDFALLRPYWKTLCFVILMPVIYTGVARSLSAGISFEMCMLGITASYPFAISEKNGMERLYGVLPVSRRHLVFGKYLLICATGLLALGISLVTHTVVLKALGETVHAWEIAVSTVLGFFVYTFYVVFQLPGYYKFGAVGGKMFQFIPVTGYLLTLVLLPRVDLNSPVLGAVLGRPGMLAGAVLLWCAAAYGISIVVSVRIVKNKEV